MNKIKDILAGKMVSQSLVKKQQLSAAMAWQILNIYPKRKNDNAWKIYKNLRGVLLADEVGSGKTFEALAILTKTFFKYLNKNKRNFRVLIIANPAIRSKWEWTGGSCDIGKFYKQVKATNQLNKKKLKQLLSDLDPLSENIIKSKNDWKWTNKNLQTKCILLASIQALPPTAGRKTKAYFKKKFKFPQNKFDLVIADEAHIVKSGYAQTDEDVGAVSNSAVRKLYAVLNSQPKAKLLLLTATPFHNNVKELKQMISLLDHESDDSVVRIIENGLERLQIEFNELKDTLSTDNNFSERVNKIYIAANNNINKLFNEAGNNCVRPNEIKKAGQKDGLDDFLRDVMIRNRKEKLKEQTRKIELGEQDKLNYLLLRDLILAQEEDGKRMISTQLCQLVSNPESLKKSFESKKVIKQSSRLKIYNIIADHFEDDKLYNLKLEELLKIVKASTLNNKFIITVFCRFIPGIDKLKADLEQREFKGRVWRLDGKTKVIERKKLLNKLEKYYQAKKKTGILLVSQVGNEGLDFDSFSDTIIHFDGHYNPAVIAQRNGRVYRRENKASNIKVYHLVLEDTYDQRIKFIEEEKKRMKDFYLGDGNLEQLFEKILKLDQSDKREKLKKLLNFKIDLQPKKKYLLPRMLKEVF